MIVVDYYSRYFDRGKLKSTTAASVIPKLKKLFATHGILEKVISDNAPPFSSKDFESFTHAWDFVHVTSSPYYPQSNGLIEKAVQSTKALIDIPKVYISYISPLEYRNTPVDGFRSPAQLLSSRKLAQFCQLHASSCNPKP